MRVVVTGIGAVSGFGWGVDALWRGLESGESAIGESTVFDTRGQRTHVAAEVGVPDSGAGIGDLRNLSRADIFAIAAAREAIRGAGLDAEGAGTGVFIGGSTAGMAECEEFVGRLAGLRPGRPALHLLASQQLNGPGDAVARDIGAAGPVIGFSSACASGAMALGAAMEAVRSGEVDLAVAGGADSLCLLTYSGFNSLRSVDEAPCRPFRGDRQGLSLGEGAGMVVLEGLERAVARGAKPLAELAGYGASCDAHHMTAPHPDGDGALAAMSAALADAGVDAEDISAVNAHGTGTPHNDQAEASALRRLFGRRLQEVPVTAPKGAVGHILGAAGALEAVATVVAISQETVFPTAGRDNADPELGIDLVVADSRHHPRDPQVWISANFAFGGANAALVIRSLV
jgi:3-oxoacyl-[acyl-carrier-protein] synthase II